MDMQTRLIHAGEERIEGAVALPIFQSSTFVSEDEQDYDDIRYLRLNNTPNHRALHAKLAAACGGEDALVTGSGMGLWQVDQLAAAAGFGPLPVDLLPAWSIPLFLSGIVVSGVTAGILNALMPDEIGG